MNGVADSLLEHSTLYREFLAECQEILRHKWQELEKAGRIGPRPREVNLPFQKFYAAFLYYMPFLEPKSANDGKR